MLSVGDEIELKIEKLVYEGYGLSHISNQDGMVCFVENVCDGDIVEAKIKKIKKNFAYAEVVKIVEPSKYRIKPFCPLHNACGGCQWQFVDYNHQLEVKQNIVKETLSKALQKDVFVEEIIPSPLQKEFRHKIQMPVSQTKNSKRFLIGYYKKNSHNLVNIKYCPIQPKIVDEIIEKIRIEAQNNNISAYNEKLHKGELRHIIIRISESNGVILICFVVNNNKISKQIMNLAQNIFDEFSIVKGVSVNFNTFKNNVILGKETKNIIGESTYIEKIDNIEYVISPDSFFQVNPSSFKNILNTVKNLIKERVNISNPKILDAYSGVGSFGLYLADIASQITCVEEVKSACENAKKACENNNIRNLEILNGDAQKIFEQQIEKNIKYDLVILDPPRKGCTKESVEYAAKLADKFIVYVSCNPNSLARDLKLFEQYGYELTYAQPVDMFCHTYHVETVTLIEKK